MVLWIAPKTTLAVSSMEYCCCLLNEGDVWRGFGGDSSHDVMIPR